MESNPKSVKLPPYLVLIVTPTSMTRVNVDGGTSMYQSEAYKREIEKIRDSLD
jgi:hypothetical protein